MRSETEDGDCRNGRQRWQYRIHHRVDSRLAIESVRVSLVRSPEACDFVLFLHHGLYGSDAREVLLDVGPKFGELFLHFPGRDPHLAFRALGIKENERHRRHDAKC